MDAPAAESTFVPLFEEAPAEAGAASAQPPVDDDFFLSSIEAEKQRAFEQGRAEGERDALRAMSEQLDAQVARWRDVVARLEREVAEALDRLCELLEERTVTIGVDVARRLLEAELRARPEDVARRVRAALERYRNEPVVTVRVNPEDLVFVEKLRPGAVTAAPTNASGDASAVAPGAEAPASASADAPASAGAPGDTPASPPPADATAVPAQNDAPTNATRDEAPMQSNDGPAPTPTRMPRDVEYVPDPSVPRGGFIVDTALARYDHTFEAELEQMSRALADLYEDADGSR